MVLNCSRYCFRCQEIFSCECDLSAKNNLHSMKKTLDILFLRLYDTPKSTFNPVSGRVIQMETIHLIGAEDVRSAGRNISSAATDMIRAGSVIDQAITNFQQQIDRLEQLLERAINELPQGG